MIPVTNKPHHIRIYNIATDYDRSKLSEIRCVMKDPEISTPTITFDLLMIDLVHPARERFGRGHGDGVVGF